MAGDTENARAGVVGRADLGEGLATDIDDILNVAERLDVVHDRWTLIKTEDGREIRGLDARVGALAFEGLNETSFLTADVSTGTAVNEDFAAVVGTKNIRTDEVGGAGFGDGFFKNAGALSHLAANVDVGLLHVIRETRDNRALDQLMRILLHDVAVLECARFRLVGINDEINRLAALAINETPLHAARETRAATTAQAGFLHLVDKFLGLARKCALHHRVTAVLEIAREVVGVAGLVDVLENDAVLSGSGHGDERKGYLRAAASALIWAASCLAFAQSTFSWSVSSIKTTGAVPQDARHSTNSTVTSPSGETSVGPA